MPALEFDFFEERKQGVETRVSGSEGDEAGGVAVGALCGWGGEGRGRMVG